MSTAARFHEAYGLPAPASPDLLPDADLVRLRTRLLRAEYERAVALLGSLSRVTDPDQARMAYRAVLARLATLRFTVDCTAVSLGLPIDDAVEAVQQAHLRADPNSATVPVPDMHLLVPDIIEVTEA